MSSGNLLAINFELWFWGKFLNYFLSPCTLYIVDWLYFFLDVHEALELWNTKKKHGFQSCFASALWMYVQELFFGLVHILVCFYK
jgi:hypothetical protein